MPADGASSQFEQRVLRVVHEAAAPVVADGRALLSEDQDADGDGFLRLTPTNPRACELVIYPGYPTLMMGPERITTEMFGPEARRLGELPLLIEAVIAGRFEWRLHQRRFLGFTRFTQLRGTFHTSEAPWSFTVQGGQPGGSNVSGSFEPY